MNIKLIAEGSTNSQRLMLRWGLSLLIGEDLLYDTFGDARIFLRNIKKFKVDLSKIKHIVLSHDHWDHVNGLLEVIGRYQDITVYICPAFNPQIKKKIDLFGARRVEVNGLNQIKKGIYTTGELISGPLAPKIPEQALVVKDKRGLIIVTGCAHPGIVNIVRYVRKQFRENIYLLIGGFHLKSTPCRQVRQIVGELKSLNIENVLPMHCTGEFAVRELKETFGKNCIYLRTGQALELD